MFLTVGFLAPFDTGTRSGTCFRLRVRTRAGMGLTVFGVAVELFDQRSLPLSSEVILVSPDPKYQSLQFRHCVAASAPRQAAEGDSGHVELSVNISWADKEALF